MDQVELRPSNPGLQAWLLFWLKWRTGFNSARRDRARLAGTLVAVAFVLLGISLGGSIGLWYALTLAPDRWQPEILHAVLAVVLLFWLVSPLVAVSLNESLDLARLFRLPISPRTMLAGIVFGSFIDVAPIAALPLLAVAALAVVGGGLRALFGVLLVLVFLASIILFSQVVMAITQRFLISRGGREALVLFAFILVFAGALGFQAIGPLIERAAQSGQPPALSQWLVWLPSGWAAEGLLSLSRGELLPALTALGGLVAFGGAGLIVGGRLIEGLLGKAGVSGPGRRSRRRPAELPYTILPAALAAVAQKEWASILRSAPGRIGLATAVIIPLVFSIALALQTGDAERPFPFFEFPIYMGAALVPFVLVIQFSANTFAYDARATRALFTLPLPSWTILAGKNLAVMTAIAVLGGIVLGLSGLALGRPAHILPASAAMLQFGLALLGLSNLLAVWFPKKLTVTALQNNPVPLPSALLSFLAGPVLAIPVVAAVLGSLLLGLPWMLTLGASLLVSAALYAAGLLAAAGQLPALQERILGNVAR